MLLFPLKLGTPIIRSVDDKFSALTFKIVMHFQVDPYPKDPDPPIKRLGVRNPALNTHYRDLKQLESLNLTYLWLR